MISRFVLDEVGPPVLLQQVVPYLIHLTALPESMEPAVLKRFARAQVVANRFPGLVFLAEDRWLHVPVDGAPRWSAEPGDFRLASPLVMPTCGHLRPAIDLDADPDAAARAARLELHVKGYLSRVRAYCGGRSLPGPAGFVFGDLTMGGRRATGFELARLRGTLPDGTPRGLRRCSACGEMGGECIRPGSMPRGELIQVSCRCSNTNRCARCLLPLAPHRLNANYFDDARREVWHMPGFEGFRHACPTAEGSARAASDTDVEHEEGGCS